MADQTPRRRMTAVVVAAGLAAVAMVGWFLLTGRPAEGPSVMAAATVTTVTGDPLAVELAAATTVAAESSPLGEVTTVAPASTLAPAATTTTAAPVTTTAAAPAASLAPATTTTVAPVTTAAPEPVVEASVPVEAAVAPLTDEYESMQDIASAAAPATTTTTTTTAADDASSSTTAVESGGGLVVAGGGVFVRPSADTVDCRGNFRRGYRVRDACVMEAVTRTWTLAWAGDVEDKLSVVWYGHLLEDAWEQRLELERSEARQSALREAVEAGEGTSAQFAYVQELKDGLPMYDSVTVEVHGGHWHEPDDIGVKLRVLYDGDVVVPWIALETVYLDGKWQFPYRHACQLWFGFVASVDCPPDPRPDWQPHNGTMLSMYSPADDQENALK